MIEMVLALAAVAIMFGAIYAGFERLNRSYAAENVKAITQQKELPREKSLRVSLNFDLFAHWIAEAKGDLLPLCHGLAKLMIVDISLNRSQDNPQLIFESMNSTGRELSQADLIKGPLEALPEELEFDDFKMYQVPVGKIEELTHISFGDLADFDTHHGGGAGPEAIERPRPVTSFADIRR